MRAAGLALALLLLLTTLPADAQATPPVMDYDIKPGTTAVSQTVNIQTMDFSSVRFRFDPADYPQGTYPWVTGIQGIVVKLAKGADEIQVQLASPASQGGGATTWVGSLPTTDNDLTKGTHVITVTAATSSGATAVDSRSRQLVVAAPETVKPQIRVSGETTDGRVRLGFGDSATVLLDDASPSSGIHRVTYRLPGIPGSLPLEFPYVLGFATFKDGPQVMTINATDRAGNSATKNVTVIADAKAPDAVVSLPDKLFVGIPATVTVAASDVNPYNVTFRVGNTTKASAGAGPNRQHTFEFVADREGPVTVTLGVFDIVGNSAEKSYTLQAEVLKTDAAVKELALSTPFPLVGQPLSLKVVLVQDPGFVPLDLNVTLRGAITTARNGTVPAAVPVTLLIPMKLAVGRHNVTANVSAPAGVVETNAKNQQRTLDFEVFFAQVTDGNRTYYIRAGSFGLPVEALRSDGKVMPLKLVEKGSAVAYEFLDGNRTVTWDPNPAQASSSSSSTSATGKAKGSPPVAAPLVLVALLALAMRRRI